MGAILHAHPVNGQAHAMLRQPRSCSNIPFYNKQHWLHVLFVEVASGMASTSWSQHYFIAIGKPKQHAHQAAHCGSKQK